jgi:hypothetical protein
LAEAAIAALQKALDLSPTHPLALHLYIHILEPSSEPQLAEEAADRLRALTPRAFGVGHLLHMPGEGLRGAGRERTSV